jgi:eukaryotic-like serine/threonine-protein kinase
MDRILDFWDKYIFVRGKNIWDILTHITLQLVLGGLFIMLFFMAFLPNYTHHRDTISVPNLVGMSMEEMTKFLGSRGIEFEIKDSTLYNPKMKPYTVTSQTPEPGMRIKKSRKLHLTANPRIMPKIQIPASLSQNMEFRDAERMLQNVKLDIGRITYKHAKGKNTILEIYHKGTKITSKQIKEGYKLPLFSKLDLLVSDGLGELEFDVPILIGLTEEEARTLIEGNELVIGNIIYDYKSNAPLGTVTKQFPELYVGRGNKKGKALEKNTIRAGEFIDIWVSGNEGGKIKPTTDDPEMDSIERLKNKNVQERSSRELRDANEEQRPEKKKERLEKERQAKEDRERKKTEQQKKDLEEQKK